MINETDLEAWEYYDSGQLNDYQRAAAHTAIYKQEHAIIYPALGLAAAGGSGDCRGW